MHLLGLLVTLLSNLLLVCNPASASGKEDAGGPPKLSILLLHSFFPSHTFPLISLGAELASRGHRVSCFGSVTNDYETRHKELLESNGIHYLNTTLFDATLFDEFRKMAKDNGTTIATLLPKIYQIIKFFKSESVYNSSMLQLEELNGSEYDYLIAEQAASPILYYLSDKWNNSNKMLMMLQSEMSPRYLQAWPYPRFTSPFNDNMTFLERLLNTGVFVLIEHMVSWLFWYIMNLSGSMPSDFFSMPIYQPTLYNTVIGLDWPKATLPLQHYVGPMFLPHPPPLQSSLTDWLEQDEKGAAPVIVISMGTTGEITTKMAEAFISLSSDYRLVWSLRESNHHVLSGLDIDKSSIYITPWLAQFTMLKHKSVKLAVLHCGLNGVQESLYNGVPVLCLPYGIDQHDTASRLESNKLGLSMLPHNVNKETLWKAVELLQDRVYYDNVQKIRTLFKTAGGVTKAAELVELYAQVGYEHGLPSFVRYKWNFVQYYNLDVWVVLALFVMLSFLGCRKICRKCRCSRCCLKIKMKRKTE